MPLMETIVCSAKKGSDARLRRLLLARQEFKRRQSGCLGAWLGKGADNPEMLLIQSVYVDGHHWKQISDRIKEQLDNEDGGVESLLLGPPLVGLFEIDGDDLASIKYE